MVFWRHVEFHLNTFEMAPVCALVIEELLLYFSRYNEKKLV